MSGTMQPFSSGTQHLDWLAHNCESGAGCRRYKPDASSSRDGCPMEVAIAMAAASCGKGPRGNEITHGHALRCGLMVPGPNGTLVAPWPPERCPEYRGKDEPDDRPRPPRPAPVDGAQLDMLDPRNEPVRAPAAVGEDGGQSS